MLKRPSEIVFISIMLVFLMCIHCIRKKKEFVWGNLRNLGSNINSPGKDEHVTFTEDGKTMYFASIREGGVGKYDIYRSTWKNGEWTSAECLPGPINTKKDEYDPFITLDGKYLFFASNRDNPGPYWDCEIYRSKWNGETWSVPEIYDSTFVTPGKPDWGAAIPRDFQTFIFSSGREPAKSQMVQIFQSFRTDQGWSEPEYLPEPVNSGEWEATPYVTPDGRFLYLNSARGRSDKKDVDIWKFEFLNGAWARAVLMGGLFKSNQHDYDPCISPDGMKFYFTSTREGGLGGADIWVAEKIFQKPPEHYQYLRETLHLDYTHPVFSQTVDRLTRDDMSLEDKLENLYYFTRDSITFIPDASFYASEVVEKQKGICYTKAMVFVAFCRLLGFPAQVAKAEFKFPHTSDTDLHGIAKMFYKGKWIYLDTVSNKEAWGYWDRPRAESFKPPVFTLKENVLVKEPFLEKVIIGDYQSNDIPQNWLQSLEKFKQKEKW